MKKFSLFIILILGLVAYFFNFNKPSYVLADTKIIEQEINLNYGKIKIENIYWENLIQVYDNTAKKPTAYFIYNDEKIFLQVDEKIEAGVYKVEAKLKDNQKEIYSIDTESKYATFTVERLEKEVYFENLNIEYSGELVSPIAYIYSVNNEKIYLDINGKNKDVGSYTCEAIDNLKNYKLKNNTTSYEITPMPVNVIWENVNLTYNGYPQKPDAFFVDVFGFKNKLNVIGGAKDVSTNNYAQALIDNYKNYIIKNYSSTKFNINALILDLEWGENTFIYDGRVHYPIAKVNTVANDVIELNYSGQQVNANPEGYFCIANFKTNYKNYVLNRNTAYCKYYILKADPVIQVKDLIDGVISKTEQDLPYSIVAVSTGNSELKIKLNGNYTSNYFINYDKYYLTLYLEETDNYNSLSMDIILDIKPNYLYYIDKQENTYFEVSSGNGLVTNSNLKYKKLDNTDSNLKQLIDKFYGIKYEILKIDKLYLQLDKEIINSEDKVKVRLKNNYNLDNLKIVFIKNNNVYESYYYTSDNYLIIDDYILGSEICVIQEINHNELFKLISIIIPSGLSFLLLFVIYLNKKIKINLYVRRLLIKLKLIK